MNIGNITSNNMNLTENGRFMQIELYEKEIERLNNKNEELLTLYTSEREVKDYYKNIINELEKWLKDYIKLFDKPDMLEEQTLEDLKEVLDKLQELKGSDKKCN